MKPIKKKFWECDLQTYQLFEKNHDTRSLQSRSHQDQSNRCAFQETIFCRDTWLRVRQRWEVDVDRVLLAKLALVERGRSLLHRVHCWWKLGDAVASAIAGGKELTAGL